MTIKKEDRASSVDMTTAAATSAPHKILAQSGHIGIDMGIDANAICATKVGQGANSLITTEKITSYSRIKYPIGLVLPLYYEFATITRQIQEWIYWSYHYIMNSQQLQDRFKNGFTGLTIIS